MTKYEFKENLRFIDEQINESRRLRDDLNPLHSVTGFLFTSPSRLQESLIQTVYELRK